METLVINTGEIRLAINGDESRVIAFNPKDVLFAERFYALMGEFDRSLTEYEKRGKELDAAKEEDANGVPLNAGARITFQKEMCVFMRDKIDYLFSAGTSQKVFGDAMSLEMFEQFFKGITPFIQSARAEKLAQYTTAASAKRNRRK